MANATHPSGNGILYFLIGAFVAAMIGFGIYYYTEGGGSNKAQLEITVSDNGIKVDGN
jgi:hypothetical protein